ncbi:MAG: DedA family protein [Rhodothermales bacterium]|nr:DedA family protein [Rhodothermales bacterium]
MGEFFLDVFEWIQTLSPLAVYVSILVIAYGENLLPPVPGDMIVVLGGYLAGTGALSLGVVIGLSTLGGALGFMTMYAFGHLIGGAVMDPDRLKWIPKSRVRRAQQWLRKWGYGVIAANRFLSGLRSVISITVGMAHMNVWKTTLWSTVSSAVWTCLIAFVGYKVGENWQVVSVWIRQYGQAIGVVILVVVIAQVIRYRVNIKRNGDGNEGGEVPEIEAG